MHDLNLSWKLDVNRVSLRCPSTLITTGLSAWVRIPLPSILFLCFLALSMWVDKCTRDV